ncbi:MAG: 50S ribosomal protein L12 [Candidatus Hodarchaeales archaeon]|jgi:large subunit ribosomal protein L12
MQYLHAALVLHTSGKKITEKGIDAIIKSAGGKPDEGKIKALVSTLESVDIDEAIKGASFMTAAAPAASSVDTGKASVGETAEAEEEEAEGDDLGLSSLFG